jgi:hypothetical protein
MSFEAFLTTPQKSKLFKSTNPVQERSGYRNMVVGSVLHGAYGDYYEQAVCLKHYRQSLPDVRLKLFATSLHRLNALRALDFSWADCFEPHTEISAHHVDRLFQFQVRDRELRAELLPVLPARLLRDLDDRPNRLPWHYLRSILPLAPDQQLNLSGFGQSILPNVMRENGIDPQLFDRPTIGFLWRHRSSGGAIKAGFQFDARQLVAKYSGMFRRLIDTYGCHVLICGMKVQRTKENMYRIDAKYPEYGLDLPEASSTFLKGLSWPLELEILGRCTLCVVNPSGFSEALWIKRGGGVILLDPPPHYLAKILWHRAPLFNLQQPRSFISAVASRWDEAAFAMITTAMDQCLRRSSETPVATLQNIAP